MSLSKYFFIFVVKWENYEYFSYIYETKKKFYNEQFFLYNFNYKKNEIAQN